MQLLLDTHALLWFLGGNKALSRPERELIEDDDNICLVSKASLWEMAIKVSLGKLKLDLPFEEFIGETLVKNKIAILEIESHHLSKLLSLAFLHRDPFDRLLIAQALSDNLPIVTKDQIFSSYAAEVIW